MRISITESMHIAIFTIIVLAVFKLILRKAGGGTYAHYAEDI